MLAPPTDWSNGRDGNFWLVGPTAADRVRADSVAPFSSHSSRRMVLDSLSVSFLYAIPLFRLGSRVLSRSLAFSRSIVRASPLSTGFSLGRTRELGLPARNL